MPNLPKIYLASKSPRRKEILLNAGFEIELVDIDVEETYSDDLALREVAEYLAIKKANGLVKVPDDGLLLAADCVVLLEGQILGKPEGKQGAYEMLKKLSGKKHTVISGVCMKNQDKMISFSDFSEVYFDELTEDEIRRYIETESPYDKAGSYGVQDWLGMCKVNRIEGSYYNIMGLPIHRVYEALNEFNN